MSAASSASAPVPPARMVCDCRPHPGRRAGTYPQSKCGWSTSEASPQTAEVHPSSSASRSERSAIRASSLRNPRSVRPTAAVRCAKVRSASRPAGHSERGWSDNKSADVERTPDATSSSENLTQTFRSRRPRIDREGLRDPSREDQGTPTGTHPGSCRGARKPLQSMQEEHQELHKAIERRWRSGARIGLGTAGTHTRPRSADALTRREGHPAR
jgi:hypothetical protein